MKVRRAFSMKIRWRIISVVIERTTRTLRTCPAGWRAQVSYGRTRSLVILEKPHRRAPPTGPRSWRGREYVIGLNLSGPDSPDRFPRRAGTIPHRNRFSASEIEISTVIHFSIYFYYTTLFVIVTSLHYRVFHFYLSSCSGNVAPR